MSLFYLYLSHWFEKARKLLVGCDCFRVKFICRKVCQAKRAEDRVPGSKVER